MKFNNIFNKLEKSKFRNSFSLNEKDKQLVIDKGMDKIEKDSYEILTKNLKIKKPMKILKLSKIIIKLPVYIKKNLIKFSKLNGIFKTLSYKSSGKVTLGTSPSLEFIANINEGRVSDFLSVVKDYTKSYSWLPHDEPGSFKGNFKGI